MSQPVSINPSPLYKTTTLTDFASGANPVYVGVARSDQPEQTLTATVSKAATAVVTSTAHGLQNDNEVVFAGGTGDWAGLNGRRVITVTGVDTFTVAVNTSAFTGDWAGTVSTLAPRTNQPVWEITKSYYTGSNNERVSSAAGGKKAWSDRATLAYD